MNGDGNENWLKGEVEEWKNQGIIDDYQAKKILSRYGLAEIPPEITSPISEDKSTKLITVISTLGAILIGVGAILFVASNWKQLPDFLKLIILFGTTFATYYVGWKWKYDTKSYPKLGHSLIFLASIFVGATIILTADIFNINVDGHWLALAWFLAILPFGYAFDSKHILGLNIFAFVLWMIYYVDSFSGANLSTYKVFMLFLLFGISLYGLGQMHSTMRRFSHFRIIYQGAGLFFILIFYFFFSLEFTYRNIFTETTSNYWTIQFLFILFGITSVISIIKSVSISDKFNTVKHEFFVLLIAFLGWVGIWLLKSFILDDLIISTTTKYGYTYAELDPTAATLLFIFFNLLLFILSIGSILIGYYKFIVPFVNLGMLFFVLGILNLYFTALYEYLPRSLAFIIGGLILLGGGWYLENKRRSLISEMESHKDE